nr:hypothetical protein [Candidatus Sigynarchaeota archaeon]
MMERSVIAFNDDIGNVYVSWRLLTTDPENISFNMYRKTPSNFPTRIASFINTTTDYIDTSPSPENGTVYWVCAVVNGTELAASRPAPVLNAPGKVYSVLRLGNSTETVSKLGIGDLDGDGSYDFVVITPEGEIDPLGPPLSTWHPSTYTYKIDAYLSNGTMLWRNDLGWGIETGTLYSPYVVYDFNEDGKAEIAIKTSDGDYRDSSGRVQSGPEYLSIWNGTTGNEIARAPWPRRQPQIYNWNSRNSIAVAYLDGQHPFILAERGTYWYLQLDAYRLLPSSLQQVWSWTSMKELGFFGISTYTGQGAHYIRVADVDNDRCDEVIIGACVIDQDGHGLWSSGMQHVDHMYVGDIDPARPGLEIYYGVEGIIPYPKKNGACLVDAATGNLVWGLNETTEHVHEQGIVSDIDLSQPGMECYSKDNVSDQCWLHSAKGDLIANKSSLDLGFSPKAVYWDSDLQRELLVKGWIYDFETNHTWASNIEGNQLAWVDLT